MTTITCPNCRTPNPAGQASCVRCNTPLPKAASDQARGRASGRGSPGTSRETSFRPGQVVAHRYTVLSLIGTGGMGCIYRVRDNTLNEEVALKTLLPQFARDKVVVERFYNEARIARQLSHANIIRVHDMGFAGNILYISMEYIQGKSLRDLLEELMPGDRLPIRKTMKIIDDLCASLEYAHQYTVHRDIKPENVMITDEGAVKLMDFGISKLMASTGLTATSMVMGTPNYMAPEQLKDSANVDVRADIYSLGVLLYECLTGNLPTGVPKPASQLIREVPPALDPILVKCLEPDPKDRFADVSELRRALKPIRDLVDSGTKSRLLVAPGERGDRSEVMRRAVGIVLILLVAAASGFGIWKLDQRRRTVVASTAAVNTAPLVEVSPFVGRFKAIEDLLTSMRKKFDSATMDDEVRDRFMQAGKERWNKARKLARQERPQALTMARHAVQCFLAPLVQPDDMVFVEPGEVSIGDDPPVLLDGFFIDTTEVSNEQYDRFCSEASWRRPLYLSSYYPQMPPADHPVTMVTFYDAQAFAAWAGKPLWARKRLPTEAQWAKAAYGHEEASRWYPWGDEWKEGACNSAGEEDGFAGTAAVGLFEDDRSPFGCLDMAGNVMEWTRTLYRGLPYDPTDGRDDEAAVYFGATMVARGGYYDDIRHAPLTARYGERYDIKRPDLGFRCVLEFPARIEEYTALL